MHETPARTLTKVSVDEGQLVFVHFRCFFFFSLACRSVHISMCCVEFLRSSAKL